jgi:valyl-tRNA synthetase
VVSSTSSRSRRRAIKAVEDGRIRFVPDNWDKTYYEWMRNIQDWCISRQLWWGHRIPAWYDEQGNIYVARSEAEARAAHGLGPRCRCGRTRMCSTPGSPRGCGRSRPKDGRRDPRARAFYPTDVLVTGFDIIFFWVARMIMMG